ncbi:PEP-CTERM sorting domain-containing protein [Nostoc sp. TCL26-01]|uniref:PEP-CTERM sorting domain-containing protein n=1 Tax=Nostoc sp. TCL26-01 TaxID=2576904 RepID=UPI0015BC34AF|nr:PEP-CTERM sorting domain-containing protein [Nostoc sp. TCL26-01]QLE58619.1 PEP-CTERM sorting domain-containing protein [Nostoc sp. TCL26-01]
MKKLSILPSVRLFAFGLTYAAINWVLTSSATAATLDLTFTQIGTINISPNNNAGTGVYRAKISDIDFDITAIKVIDILGQGGTPGKFSGFDLDAIKISDSLITNAEDVKRLSDSNVFDFTPNGTKLTAGTMRATTRANFRGNNLFGTKDGNVDNSIARLQSFDAVAETNQNAAGFVSLGDGGEILFQLTQRVAVPKPSSIYVYIAEVGNNGERARGQVTLIGKRTRVPEPTSLLALPLIGIYLLKRMSQVNKTV